METKGFAFGGHQCTLICPDIPAKGKPWVWRAEFLGAFDYADKALQALVQPSVTKQNGVNVRNATA